MQQTRYNNVTHLIQQDIQLESAEPVAQTYRTFAGLFDVDDKLHSVTSVSLKPLQISV